MSKPPEQVNPSSSSSSSSSNRRVDESSGRTGGRGGRGSGRNGRGRPGQRGGGRGRGRGRQQHRNANRQRNKQTSTNENTQVQDSEGPTMTQPNPVIVNPQGNPENRSNHSTKISTNTPSEVPQASKVLVLPKAPKTTGNVPMILSRSTHPPDSTYEEDAKILSERLADVVLCDDNDEESGKVASTNAAATTTTSEVTEEQASKAKPKKKKPKKPKKSKKPPIDEPSNEDPISTTDALKALPAQEVSITAANTVKITPVTDTADDAKNSKSASKSKKGKKDPKSDKKAARRFNNDVRNCVANSDPDQLLAILHDRSNQKFALDGNVLELTLKAYVVAAMFDHALYCLRNCTLPDTLNVHQAEKILLCMPQNLRNCSNFMAADMINALCVATKFESPSMRPYFLRIVRGIALEFLEEATSARDRICSASCERLVRSGLCTVNAKLERGKKPTEIVVKPGDQLGVFVSDASETRGIQAGDAVSILPYAGPYPMSAESLDRNMIEAVVTNTNPMVLKLQDKINATILATLTESIEGNRYRIDKLSNRMGYNRQLAAAVSIASEASDFRRPCSQIIQAITAMDENIETAFMRGQATITSTAALCAMPVPWNAEDEEGEVDEDGIRTTYRLALEKYGSLEGLNLSQQLAVEGATTQRLTLVQGPPGTGKTRIAIRILEHWARLAKAAAEQGENPKPIIATSDSNIAVDNLVEGCASVGLRVVRLGRPEAIRPELLRYCIDRPPSTYDRGGSGHGNSIQYAYKERMKQLKSAQIVCCTCIGSGADLLDALGPLERVLVDEATQATEPAVLVPLMRGCRQLVLVGDHCQLPPTVLSTRAEEEGHHVPLFSRMVACGVPPFMLDTQYRMHPAIAMFPSDLFYGGLLKNGVSAPERRPLQGFPWPREEFPVAFIPVKGVEMDDGVSKFNQMEAEAACDAVKMLLQGGKCTVSDIAVVTPYAAQARLIRRMTRQLTGTTGPPFVEVSSVDGFQGREKEAVVFSAVRSNDFGQIGFTSDWRRINVSFTRARRALIVIGNDQTLRRGDPDTWMPWLAWADAHGINMDKPGVGRGRYEPEQLRRVRGGTTAAEMLKDVLMRQQAQLKQSEKQQERALKHSEGYIVGEDDEKAQESQLTVEEKVALLENTDGHWDDSDDEDHKLASITHSPSKTSLANATSTSSNPIDEPSEGAVDVWDL